MANSSSDDDTPPTPDSENVGSILNDFVDDPSPETEPTDETEQKEGDPDDTTVTASGEQPPAAHTAAQSDPQTDQPTAGDAETDPEQSATGIGETVQQTGGRLIRNSLLAILQFIAALWISTVAVGKRWIQGGSDPENGLAGLFYPADKISDTETVTWADTPSRWHAVGPWSLAVFWFTSAIALVTSIQTGLFSSWVSARLPQTVSVTPPEWWPAVAVIFVLLGILSIAGETLRRASTWYVVTEDRIIHRYGIISSRLPVIQHSNITSAEERNPFPLNLVNVGHIDVYTASVDGLELRVNVIKGPKSRENQLNSHRESTEEQQQETDSSDLSTDSTRSYFQLRIKSPTLLGGLGLRLGVVIHTVADTR